jgi:hypothetical protein
MVKYGGKTSLIRLVEQVLDMRKTQTTHFQTLTFVK